MGSSVATSNLQLLRHVHVVSVALKSSLTQAILQITFCRKWL